MGLDILVVQTAFLGDVVLTTPLFRALRRLHPGSRLAALVTPQAAPLLEEDPHLDLVLRYDKKGGQSLWAMARALRGRFDLLLSPHRSHRSSLLALASGARRRIGFADAAFPWCYHAVVPRPLALHEVDRNLALLRGLGHEALPGDRVLHVGYTAKESDAVDRVLRAHGVGPTEPLAGLCPGSIWPTKRWPAEAFSEAGKRLAAHGFRVVVLGGPDDEGVGRQVCDGLGGGAVLAAGATPLKALAAWMDRLRVLVTNDSAPLHVAAARGTPAVAVFGATTTTLGFGPFHPNSRVAQAQVACRPCGLHGGRRCPEGHFRCMNEVTPAAVSALCLELLGGAP